MGQLDQRSPDRVPSRPSRPAPSSRRLRRLQQRVVATTEAARAKSYVCTLHRRDIEVIVT
jgi:hypothetical protein